ncbi:MAG: outer membrane lipid asymmetry maintenance protein MlaD [Myxococcales bacterium]|jgi:phospholipid/cholesterol/gamma-HCH transport system substrate-binding protein|nr:MAG: outer membrane lipid asymmetry maintenance protein MlaD [Myxococcales bacterium]
MSERSTRDFIVGLFVLVGLMALTYLSLKVGGVSYTGRGGIKLYAAFDQIADLKIRAPVELSGVTIGQVTGIALDDDYRARVELSVRPDVELPIDTSASIVTSGLLGDRYITLDLGAEADVLADGDDIEYTESAVVLERLLGKFLYNVQNGD